MSKLISLILLCCACLVLGQFPMARNMFEISTRPWLYYLSQKYGQNITMLSQIPQIELVNIKNNGFEIVWFMGVWQLGAYGLNYDKTNPQLLQHYAKVLPGYTQADIIGSPYAVYQYSCNPELGSDSDIKNLKSRVNALGMKLGLDFVPNHSAVDAPLVTLHPEYYIHAPKGTNPPYNPELYYSNGIAYGNAGGGEGWFDTLQFNIWNNDTRTSRTNELLKVASLSDFIRCDMAYLFLNDLFYDNWQTQLNSWGFTRPSTEFWADAISTVKKQYPDIIFLAEVYSPWQPATQAVGFDYTYDKQLYDRLGNGNMDSIRQWISTNSISFIQHSAHFVSNHDQPRAADYFGSWQRADAAALITFTLPGLRFVWMWDNWGVQPQICIQLRREANAPIQSGCEDFYKIFYPIISEDVMRLGQWIYLQVQNSNNAWPLVAYRWQYQNKNRLCVINYTNQQGSGAIVLSNAEAKNGNDTIPVTDLLTNTTYYRSAKEMRTTGLYVIVDPQYAQIFSY